MMFDNELFATSELYFTILQLLRIASDWIREGMEDLENLAGQSQVFIDFHFTLARRGGEVPATVDVSEVVSEVIERNWENVVSHQKSLAKPLLERIEKKSEEVKSLRDGVCLNSKETTYHDMLTVEAALQRNSSARSVKKFNSQPLYPSVYRHDDYLPPLEFHSRK
jgi:hypothetical protein